MKRRVFIKTLLLSAGSLITGSHNLIASAMDKNTIKLENRPDYWRISFDETVRSSSKRNIF